MTHDIIQHSNDSNALAPQDAERLEAFAQVADRVTSDNRFAKYRDELTINTTRAHDYDLSVFADYLQRGALISITGDTLASDPQAWASITYGIVETFTEWLISQGYALSTVNRRLATVRKYADLSFKAGVLDAQTIAMIKTVKGYTGKRAVNRDEKREQTRILRDNGKPIKKPENVRIPGSVVKKLKTDHDMSTPQGRRDAVLMSLLLDHAMRASEASAVTVSAVDFEAETIRFYRIKTKTWQTDKLTPDSLEALQAYLDDMPASDKPLLRASKKNGELTHAGISSRTITRIVNKLGEQYGIEGLSAHDCRHSWATRAYLADTHPQDIMQGGGWKTMTMVNRYTDELEISNERVSLAT
ncbi:MAG: tyrosine-type recombinase/integrase [Chloroflexota bacterium]